jgi:uroporphyrinogen-III synthase
MRVLVTRPAAQAEEWAAQLRARGIDAAALPLIDIVGPDDPAALPKAWRSLADRRLVVFVSPNAVEQFFAGQTMPPSWPPGVLAGSPGPGTTRALVALGVPSQAIVAPAADATQFDSETLWSQLATRPWTDADVLIVRGDGGREWLADALRQAGARVELLCAYRRRSPRFDAPQANLLRDAVASAETHLWCFSSSEAIDNLAAMPMPDGAPVDWARASALATHPRIAARARTLGFGRVSESRPEVDAVVACIQSAGP